MDDLQGRIAAAVAGLDLRLADVALDEARRRLWLAALTGRRYDAAAPGEIESRAAVVAQICADVPAWKLADVLDGARMILWVEQLPDADVSVFEPREART